MSYLFVDLKLRDVEEMLVDHVAEEPKRAPFHPFKFFFVGTRVLECHIYDRIEGVKFSATLGREKVNSGCFKWYNER